MRFLTAPLRMYLPFLRANLRFITFGFVLTLASSFGQTFFIALSSADIRESFGLTDGAFGLRYSLATLASGISIIWLGSLIDRIDVKLMSLAVCGGMIIACLLMAVTPNGWILIPAIYLLRLNGQGLLGHISTTCMARYFDRDRGKAISLASLGYPAGEAVLPILGVMLITWIGWRGSWLVIAGVLFITLLPLIFWLLIGHGDRHRAYVAANISEQAPVESTSAADAVEPISLIRRDRSRSDVVRDPTFYLLMPAVLAPAFIVTGLFFHQIRLVEEKGWQLEWFASCFLGFAAAQLVSSLGAGAVIDRIGARRLLPFFLLPLITGLIVLATVDHPIAALVVLILIGFTGGMIGPLINSTWAELYGVTHLGAIRSLVTACMVLSTSLSPVLLGWLIDGGMRLETIVVGLAGFAAGTTVLATCAMALNQRSSTLRPELRTDRSWHS